MMTNRKLFYGILIIAGLAVVGIGLFIHLKRPATPPPTGSAQPELTYSVGGCADQEEREYLKTKDREENVEVEIVDGFVTLTHQLNYVCCAEIKVDLDSIESKPDYTLIKLSEKNEGEMCKCVCDYKIDTQVGPLEKGDYLIQIWGIEFEDQVAELLWEKEVSIAETSAQLPNPASVYCEQQGGTLEIRTDADGSQGGFCLFADGSECEEWEFFRGECKEGEKFCKDLCGDGVCQEVVCEAIGCPCPEGPEVCPEDCK